MYSKHKPFVEPEPILIEPASLLKEPEQLPSIEVFKKQFWSIFHFMDVDEDQVLSEREFKIEPKTIWEKSLFFDNEFNPKEHSKSISKKLRKLATAKQE